MVEEIKREYFEDDKEARTAAVAAFERGDDFIITSPKGRYSCSSSRSYPMSGSLEAFLQIHGISGGVVTAVSIINPGAPTIAPSRPVLLCEGSDK